MIAAIEQKEIKIKFSTNWIYKPGENQVVKEKALTME